MASPSHLQPRQLHPLWPLLPQKLLQHLLHSLLKVLRPQVPYQKASASLQFLG